MKLRQTIYKATLLVDLKNDFDSAIDLLSQSLETNYSQIEAVDFIQAKIFLAELLFNQNRNSDAEMNLQEIIKLSNVENFEFDLIEPEIAKAKLLLEKIKEKL